MSAGLGCAEGRRPGAATSLTIIGDDGEGAANRRATSGWLLGAQVSRPRTGPPLHCGVVGAGEIPTSTMIPGPSAPVRQEAMCRHPDVPSMLRPASVVQPTTFRQCALVRR